MQEQEQEQSFVDQQEQEQQPPELQQPVAEEEEPPQEQHAVAEEAAPELIPQVTTECEPQPAENQDQAGHNLEMPVLEEEEPQQHEETTQQQQEEEVSKEKELDFPDQSNEASSVTDNGENSQSSTEVRQGGFEGEGGASAKIAILDDWEDTDSQQSEQSRGNKSLGATVNKLMDDWADEDDDESKRHT